MRRPLKGFLSIPSTVFLEPLLVVAALTAAGAAYTLASPGMSVDIMRLLLAAGILRRGWLMVRDALHGHFGVDLLALAAMAVSFLLNEWLAGSVILLMLTGGEALEAYASARARRDLSELLDRAPHTAHRKEKRGLHDIPVDDVRVGDLLVVKPGEIVPVDGVIVSGRSSFDEALLTGESLASEKGPHQRILGGSVNQTGVIEMHAAAGAEDSQYRRMVALVREAEQKKAPFVRLADRYSVGFTVASFSIAAATWLLTDDASRPLAVLVVATPCPLILATPIALLSGISRSAARGIIMKNGGALETLSRVRALVFDKTGTLTYGTPAIAKVLPLGETEHDVLQHAASLDQFSSHPLASALLNAAAKKNITLLFPKQFKETPGKGVEGKLDGTRHIFGRLRFLEERGVAIPKALTNEDARRKTSGMRTVYLAADKKIVGGIAFADTVRPGLPSFFRNLSRLGIRSVAMLTGDKERVAKRIARDIGIRNVRAECLPEDKVKEIKRLQRGRTPVAMIGDGMNDAPALATADVGIAMGAVGSGIASESADIVITIDDVTRVGDAIAIAQKTMRVARTGIVVGITLSFGLMAVASAGLLPPLYGAIAQEAVDVIVILNALRVVKKD